VGIGRETARSLMPLVGTMDITVAFLVLWSPRLALLAWMVLWATWTAMLRPLSGESSWEALERAGNYGVALALLLLAVPRSWREWRRSASPLPDAPRWTEARMLLAVVTALLFLGHGALALSLKPGIEVNFAAVVPATSVAAVTWGSGLIEVVLSLLILLRPSFPLAFGMAAWKILTESLFVPAGSPGWEVVERSGSYAAPLALGLILLLSARDDSPAPGRG
jgi:hypothetical protein